MASFVASCEGILPTNVSNHVNFRQHFRLKEVQLDRHQRVTKWSESKPFTSHLLKTESETDRPELDDHNRSSEHSNFDHALMKPQNIEQRNPIKSEENTFEGNKNEGYIGICEGIDCLIQVEKKKVTNADDTIMIKTVKPKEGDAFNQEGKNKHGLGRVCRVVSIKDKEFLRRIKQTPNISDEMLKTNELSVSTEAKNSEFAREAKNYHDEEKKIQMESTLATPNSLPSIPHLSNSEPLLNANARSVTRTSENRVTVEVKIRVQPNKSTPSPETERNRGTVDDRHEIARESSANRSVFDLTEAKRRLCDQNYSPTSKEIQAANTYEISRIETAFVPKELQTSLKVSKDDDDSKQLSLNVDVQSRQDTAVTNRDDFLGEISHDDDNEADDSSHATRDQLPAPVVVLSQMTDKTSLHDGFNIDEMSSATNAGDETIRNSTESRPAIEDFEHTNSGFQLDVNRKPTELRARRRAVTIAGINPELSEIMKNYQTSESFLLAEYKKNDVTKSEENLGSVGNLRENHTNAVTEPKGRMSLGRSISLLHQHNAYGLQPRLWKLPSFRSYSNNKTIFTNDRGLLQQLSDEVKDILIADARRRRINSNEIQKTREKTEDDKQQLHTDANYQVRTEDRLSLENQFNSTFNDATEFQGVQPERSNPEETGDLYETISSKFHYNGAADVVFPTSESIIIQNCGSNLSTSEFASKPRPSAVAYKATDKITEPKPCANHINEKDERNSIDALSDDMLAKALERMMIIAASEEYLKLVDLTEREGLESVLRRQRKDGRQFQLRRSLHDRPKCLPANEKLQNPLAESSEKSYGFAQKVDDDDDKDEEPSISFSESLNNRPIFGIQNNAFE